MANNITTATFESGQTFAKASPGLWQWNRGQVLMIEGIELPTVFKIHFSNSPAVGTSKARVGSASGTQIPNEYLESGKTVYAFFWLSESESVAETLYRIDIPVAKRPEPTDEEPSLEEESEIDGLIAALNAGVKAAEGSAEDAEAWAVGERNGEPVTSEDETYENNARFYAGEAEEQADRSEEKSTLAESWAVGGTGTRENEDNDNAKHYSILAAQGAEESGYAWFDVHDDDGHMYVYISDNLSEDVSFAINESTGHLEVTYN